MIREVLIAAALALGVAGSLPAYGQQTLKVG